MAFDYSELVTVAQSLIAEFGRSVTFVALSDTPANPATPWLGPTSPRGAPSRTLVLKSVFVEPSSLNALGNQAVSDDFLKRATQIALVYSSVELAEFDELLDSDSSRWQVQEIAKLKPGSTLLLFFVSVKR